MRTSPLLVLTLMILAQSAPNQAASAPMFELPRWEAGDMVKLSGFAGKVIVLDFFAYWCAPCKRASGEVEKGIQKYYTKKKGNPHGVAVQVVSINIEKAHPQLTARFIEQTGAELVLNDFEGKLLATLEGEGTPFLVIIDGTRATAEKPDFRILYKHAGFEGTGKLREIIDRVKPPAGDPSKSSETDEATGPPTTQSGDAALDILAASDVEIASLEASYGQKRAATEWKINLSHNRYSLDYKPFEQFDFLGFSERLNENNTRGQGSVRYAPGKSITILGSAGGYEGFTDYRSIWLANYYRQQFSFVPGYQDPNPRGVNASSGLRWEYQPATGFLEAGFYYGHDEIAPGYDLDPATAELHQSRETLHTYSPTIRLENVLTRRLRALHEFQLAVTSGREPRLSYRGSVNAALGERWVARISGGYTHENPVLRAWFAGATLEYEFLPKWRLNFSGLYYHDTGEIENSLFISTAAPGVQTYQVGLGLRYVGEWSSFSLSAAPVRAEYDPIGPGARPFANLYRDRTWLHFQAAWAIEI